MRAATAYGGEWRAATAATTRTQIAARERIVMRGGVPSMRE